MNLLGIFEVFYASWPKRVCRLPHDQQNLNPLMVIFLPNAIIIFPNMKGLKSQLL